jgi:hypothetical protein
VNQRLSGRSTKNSSEISSHHTEIRRTGFGLRKMHFRTGQDALNESAEGAISGSARGG